MATQTGLVRKDCEACQRTENALNEIQRRHGLPPVELMNLAGRQSITELDIGHSTVEAVLAEALLRVSNDVAELRVQVAALKSAPRRKS
jgi:hypothetical protein